MIKEIIWDWNGTLLNDAQYCVNQINIVLERYNLPKINLEKYRRIFTFPIIDYYKNLGFDFEKYSFAEVGKEFIDLYNENITSCNLYPDALNTLKLLKNKGIKQTVISARKHFDLAEDLRRYGVLPYIDEFFGIENIYGEGKEKLFEKYLKQTENKHENIVLIGDTRHDCDIANRFSLNFIYIETGHQDIAFFKGCNILKSIKNLSELLSLNFDEVKISNSARK